MDARGDARGNARADAGATRSPDRAFRVGFLGNGALAALKLAVGWVAGSRSLVADGWHSLSDLAVNGGTWLAYRISRREPDDDHHYGHGKLEAFSGLIVGSLLVAGGLVVIVTAWTSKATLESGWKAWAALGVAGVSIAGNLAMAWVTSGAARESRSHGLLALTRDKLSDALAGVLVVAGILGARTGLTWTEPVAAVGIGVLILVMGWRSASEGFHVLMDRADPALRELLLTTAHSVPAVRDVQSVRVHPLGTDVSVDMEISVDGDLTVAEGHAIAHSVESAVTEAHLPVREVHVHVNPARPSAPALSEEAPEPPSGPPEAPASELEID